MLGSAYYARNPQVPLEDTIININVDMVGRAVDQVSVYAVGSGKPVEITEGFGAQSGIKVVPDDNPAFRIIYFLDSYHFAKADIPIIEFFTNMHEDYHQPSDEIEKIEFEGLGKITDLVTRVVHHYLDGGQRPEFERPEWFLTP